VLNPGAGDEVQMMKAGILEAADIFVINKCDLAGAEQLKQSLMSMLSMTAKSAINKDWEKKAVMAEANSEKGMDELADVIARHHEIISSNGELERRRQEHARLELAWAVDDYLQKHMDNMDQGRLAQLVKDLAQRKTNPRAVVSDIISCMSTGGRGGFFAD
jgi:LAO/AO transport system kinase